jgi:uncharacterized protein
LSPLAHGLRGAVLAYRYTLSGLIGRTCRFAPSCSEYAAEAIERHGAFGGSWLALRRIARCHPWGGSGYDPVPESLYTTGRSDRAPRGNRPAV